MSEPKDSTYYLALTIGSSLIILITGLILYANRPKPKPEKTTVIIYRHKPQIRHHQQYDKFYSGGYNGQ